MKPSNSFPNQTGPLLPVTPRQAPTGLNQNAPIVTTGDKKAKGVDTYGKVQVVGLPIFNSLAGVSEEEHSTSSAYGSGKPQYPSHKRLTQRVRPSTQRRSGSSEKKTVSGATVRIDDDPDDADLHSATSHALAVCHKNGWHSFKSLLSTKYEDPLERYALLHNMLVEVEKEPQTPETVALRHDLRVLKARVIKKNRDVLRNGLAGKDAMQSMMTSLGVNTGISPASIPELRYLYGAKGRGKFDAPLTPFAMAKILLQKFGAENFSGALGELRAKMATDLLPDLRRRKQRHQPPYLWLSLADAAAFNSVQSSFGIACDLRRDLVDKARVFPKASHAAIAVLFLGIAEGGKGKAAILVNQIVDIRDMDDLQKAKGIGIIQASVKRLPTTMWPPDKQSQRLELIDELTAMVIEGHKGISPWQEKAQKREKEWHTKLAMQGQIGNTQGDAPPAYAEKWSKTPAPVQREKSRSVMGTELTAPPSAYINVET